MSPKPSVPVFGDERWIATAKALRHGRGRAGRRPGQPWADIRGAGPEDKKCKTCRFLTCKGGTVKTFYKCGKAPITGGPGTDIRLKDPACMLYEEEK